MGSDRDDDRPAARLEGKDSGAERKKRLAAALRANLRRRKQQARQRDAQSGDGNDGSR